MGPALLEEAPVRHRIIILKPEDSFQKERRLHRVKNFRVRPVWLYLLAGTLGIFFALLTQRAGTPGALLREPVPVSEEDPQALLRGESESGLRSPKQPSPQDLAEITDDFSMPSPTQDDLDHLVMQLQSMNRILRSPDLSGPETADLKESHESLRKP